MNGSRENGLYALIESSELSALVARNRELTALGLAAPKIGAVFIKAAETVRVGKQRDPLLKNVLLGLGQTFYRLAAPKIGEALIDAAQALPAPEQRNRLFKNRLRNLGQAFHRLNLHLGESPTPTTKAHTALADIETVTAMLMKSEGRRFRPLSREAGTHMTRAREEVNRHAPVIAPQQPAPLGM